MKMCLICGQNHRAKGYCGRHYMQLRMYGRITDAGPSRRDKRPAILNENTAQIPLGVNAKDGYTIVDRADAWLDKYNWVKDKGYAQTMVNGKKVKLHSLLLRPPRGMEVDHRDNNKLNNRLSNLRICTHAENIHNRSLFARNKSGYKGVSFYRALGKYRAQIMFDGEQRHLGYYVSAEDAGRAYDLAATTLHGSFASTNGIVIRRDLK